MVTSSPVRASVGLADGDQPFVDFRHGARYVVKRIRFQHDTGSGSRMADFISPFAQAGVAGHTTFKPGTWANQEAKLANASRQPTAICRSAAQDDGNAKEPPER